MGQGAGFFFCVYVCSFFCATFCCARIFAELPCKALLCCVALRPFKRRVGCLYVARGGLVPKENIYPQIEIHISCVIGREERNNIIRG